MAVGNPSDSRAIVVTAANETFFDLLDELLLSLERAEDAPPLEVGCLDLGLSAHQVSNLMARGVHVVQPATGLTMRGQPVGPTALSYLARPYLPDNFPGYQVYVWLDADTWVQRGRALVTLINAANEHGAAMVREDDPTYKSNLGLFLWKAKHYLFGYGPWRGARLLFSRQINNGVFAMRADAPHWAVWRHEYQAALMRTNLPAPHDQFALNAAVHLGGAHTRFLPATFNWICDLSKPDWDEDASCFCSPGSARLPIEVIHLAGPIKNQTVTIRTTRGRTLHGMLRYGALLEDEPA
jgi:hypothetical protein